jgi:hypothetical protein
MVPDRAATDRARRYGGLGAAALGLGALAYVGAVDPHRAGSPFPPCPFRLLTGWYCPGCGGLRMTHDLLHADLAAAAVDNLFLLVALPLLGLWWLWRRQRGRPPVTVAAVAVIVVATVGWTVVRNLPGFPLIPTVYGS